MRKWIVRFLVALFLLFITSIAVLIIYIRTQYSPEKIKAELETTLSRKTGFTITAETLDFTWNGNIRIRKICFKNPALKDPRCFVAADIASLDLAILPLMKKRIEILGAHLQNMQVNFFSEKQTDLQKKIVEYKSWEIPQKQNSEATGANVPQVSLKVLKITEGTIVHEYPILPIPLGVTKFETSIRQTEVQKITATAIFPDSGKAATELTIDAADILRSLRRLAATRRFEDTDQADGTLRCERCNLSRIDTRLQSLTGDFSLKLRNNAVTLNTTNGQIAILSPLAGTFGYKGIFTAILPTLDFAGGSGSLSTSGLTVNYKELVMNSRDGVSAAFDAAIDLVSAQSILKLPENLLGKVWVSGRLQQNAPQAAFTMKDFSYLVQGLKLTSAGFSGQLNGLTIAVTNQNFLLNQNPFTATAIIHPARKTVTGNLQFPHLDIDSLSPEKTGPHVWLADNVSARVSIDDKSVAVENGVATVAHGRVAFSLRRARSDGAQNVRLQFTGLKAKELSQSLKLKGTIFSDISGEASLSWQPATMRQSLTGDASIRFSRGKIKDSFFQNGILTGPLHKLEEKLSDIEFASASVDATFKKGAISIRKFYFDAEEWSITARAEAEADSTGKAALNFKFRSSFVENVANPLYLGIDSRKEGEYYDLPFACRGNIFEGSCYKANW